ncbi:MAG: hypothetical protein JW839_21570 [Candidatus Lokiarchaeota archaeon]|nr:hypothetical protein [Candidatus Lokiarchaeota archaeon]
MTKKKGYVFLELKSSEDPKKIANRILDKFLEKKKDYSCSVVGKYDVVIEKDIDDLAEVDDVLSKIRGDEKIGTIITKSTTFIGVRQP